MHPSWTSTVLNVLWFFHGKAELKSAFNYALSFAPRSGFNCALSLQVYIGTMTFKTLALEYESDIVMYFCQISGIEYWIIVKTTVLCIPSSSVTNSLLLGGLWVAESTFKISLKESWVRDSFSLGLVRYIFMICNYFHVEQSYCYLSLCKNKVKPTKA